MDDNQRVYDASLEVPDEYRPFDLTVNCRNTQAIHAEVMKLYHGVVKPEVKGPPGRMLQLLHTDDEAGTVVSVLDDPCGREDIRSQDVVVLSAHGREHSAIYAGETGPWQYTDKRGRKGKRVFFSHRSGASRAWSPRWWSSASWATSIRSRATTRSMWECRGRATTA